MSSSPSLPELPDGFRGRVRLFPLPNLVLFPHAAQMLRVFEPRYRAMFEDAVRDDALITMAKLAPNWEQDYYDRPAICPVVCLGKIVSHTQEPSGDYRFLLQGLRRARLITELVEPFSYRTAQVKLLDDFYPVQTTAERGALQDRLRAGFERYLPDDPELRSQFAATLQGQLPLGVLTDIIAFTLGFSAEFKQQLLEECNVDRRAELLLEQMPAKRSFPPDFSSN